MKKTINFLAYAIMTAIVCVLVTSCAGSRIQQDLWETATYKEDKEFGNGEKTILVAVGVEENLVTFKINTDKATLGDALIEHNLISGENGPYGLYIKVVNGIVADYDINQSYWSLCKDGEYMQTGVDVTEISDGEHYELIYTKI